MLINLGSTRKSMCLPSCKTFVRGVWSHTRLCIVICQEGVLICIGWSAAEIDYRVFLSTLGISGLVSLLFGLYPVEAAKINPVDALPKTRRSETGV